MGRSGYSDDFGDDNSGYLYRGAVQSAIYGRRGQAFLKEMLVAMDALPEPKPLIAHDLEKDGVVCAIGCVGRARGIDMSKMDPEDAEGVATKFVIAEAMAREIVFENDDEFFDAGKETPEQRFARMRTWIVNHLRPENR